MIEQDVFICEPNSEMQIKDRLALKAKDLVAHPVAYASGVWRCERTYEAGNVCLILLGPQAFTALYVPEGKLWELSGHLSGESALFEPDDIFVFEPNAKIKFDITV